MDAEQQQIMSDLADDLSEMKRHGYVACRVCGYRFYGDDLGDLLQQLGEHGEDKHPGVYDRPVPGEEQ